MSEWEWIKEVPIEKYPEDLNSPISSTNIGALIDDYFRLIAERDELKEELQEWRLHHAKSHDDKKKFRSQLDRLVDAASELLKEGDHTYGCLRLPVTEPCNCGVDNLRTVLAEMGGE